MNDYELCNKAMRICLSVFVLVISPLIPNLAGFDSRSKSFSLIDRASVALAPVTANNKT